MPTPWSSPTSKYLKLIQIKKIIMVRAKESMPFFVLLGI